MRKRKGFAGPDSLELLLDTITNAFGGIVFLAILIVVLLQNTTLDTATDRVDKLPDAMELSHRLQDLEEAIRPLEMQVRAAEQIAARLSDPTLRATLAELERQREVRQKLESEKVRVLQELADMQQDLKAMDEQHAALDDDLSEASGSIAVLTEELEAERARRKINSPFPEERVSTKVPHTVTIRYGRWYVDHHADGTPNLDDFAVLGTEGEYLAITPKPYRGRPIMEGDALSESLQQELGKLSPHVQRVDVGIWDDSYSEFQPLRDHFVEHGIDYRLIPVTDGDDVKYGFVGESRVQ